MNNAAVTVDWVKTKHSGALKKKKKKKEKRERESGKRENSQPQILQNAATCEMFVFETSHYGRTSLPAWTQRASQIAPKVTSTMVKQTSSQRVRLHPQRFHCQLRSSQRWQKSSDQINKRQGLLSILSTTCPFPPSSIVPQKHKNTNYTVSHYHYSIFLPSASGYYTEWNSSKNKQTAPSKLFPHRYLFRENQTRK